MKRLTYFVMALALVLGFTQCKKEQIATTENEGEKVTITLKLDNGSRGHIEPGENTAAVVYDNGDIIMVGFNGAYVGDLTTTDGSTFSGTVDISGEPTDGKIHFYYLDGKSQTVDNGECTVDISNQTGSLPVISYACVDYNSNNTYSNVKMHNQCALVKFNLGDVSTDAAITLTGLKNTATIGFDGTVTNGTATGNIVTYGTGSTRYAVVLSDQTAVTGGSISAEGYEGTFNIPSAAYTNAFLTDASMTLTVASIDPLATPLTFEALSGGTVRVKMGDGTLATGMKYSVNGGDKILITTPTIINVNAGDKVQFYGNGTNTTCYNDEGTSHVSGTRIAGGTASVKAYGNIMSLVDEENFATATILTSERAFNGLFNGNQKLSDVSGLLLPATTLTNNCYGGMFSSCTGLTDASSLLLPATTLADYCYASMFSSCTGLTTAPALPAMTLADQCYTLMFYSCTSLTSAPALPATTLAENCYRSMFSWCTSLTTPPMISATTLARFCCLSMFDSCTSLTTTPVLPATTLAFGCYHYMFRGCTGLTTASELPATTLEPGCYECMFQGCTGLTVAPELPATTLVSNCYNEMFRGCTSLTTAPELPATTLATYCYYGIFRGCTSLAAAPELPATTLPPYCYQNMFDGCTSLTAAPALPATRIAQSCYYSMFNGCTGLTSAPALPATTLAYSCYQNMFNGCTGLTSAPALPATTLFNSCYQSMFQGCTGLTAAPALPATTLFNYCYRSMFQGCTGLTTAPVLPATTLKNCCYQNMFNGCTRLNSVTCLATDISASNCTDSWLDGVAATGTFTKASGATWPEGASGIPANWTVISQ